MREKSEEGKKPGGMNAVQMCHSACLGGMAGETAATMDSNSMYCKRPQESKQVSDLGSTLNDSLKLNQASQSLKGLLGRGS